MLFAATANSLTFGQPRRLEEHLEGDLVVLPACSAKVAVTRKRRPRHMLEDDPLGLTISTKTLLFL